MKSKKGMELSINMVVVLILGLIILGGGLSIFFNSFPKVTELQTKVNEENQRKLEVLLDNGGTVVVAMPTKEGERGEYVDFSLGINNELNNKHDFFVDIKYNTTTAIGFAPPNDLFEENCDNQKECGAILYMDETYSLENNEHIYVPIRIVLPKTLKKGQYLFDLDVCYDKEGQTQCILTDTTNNRYGSRQILTVNIK
ncbi:MAG: hypothetical protein AB7V77_01165 [Candidatus Woesearchaeota archaeon]